MSEQQDQHQDQHQHQSRANKEIELDFPKVTKEVAEKTTIEDSVETLLIAISNELITHIGEVEYINNFAHHLVLHSKALSSAVADNVAL